MMNIIIQKTLVVEKQTSEVNLKKNISRGEVR